MPRPGSYCHLAPSDGGIGRHPGVIRLSRQPGHQDGGGDTDAGSLFRAAGSPPVPGVMHRRTYIARRVPAICPPSVAASLHHKAQQRRTLKTARIKQGHCRRPCSRVHSPRTSKSTSVLVGVFPFSLRLSWICCIVCWLCTK